MIVIINLKSYVYKLSYGLHSTFIIIISFIVGKGILENIE